MQWLNKLDEENKTVICSLNVNNKAINNCNNSSKHKIIIPEMKHATQKKIMMFIIQDYSTGK